ncbi:MAG: hypothetical protein M3O98_02815 [Actinomycetota bacterium]|nr:hypothetical protein [Actinomycetota bacterium]
MGKHCEFEDPDTHEACSYEPEWIADVGWTKDSNTASAPRYTGTSWRVALCATHFELLRAAGRITGTAHPVTPKPEN